MFDPTTLVGFHTWLSLVALAAGILVVADLLRGRTAPGISAFFLATALATSVTGFAIPAATITPAHIVGAMALAVLAVTLLARYRFVLAGRWRAVYAAGAVASLYFLVFVTIAQLFTKVAALQALTPGAPQAGFAVAEGIALAAFVYLGFVAVRTRAPAPAAA